MTANTPRTGPQRIARPQETVTGRSPSCAGVLSALAIVAAVFEFGFPVGATHASEPAKGTTKQVDLGGGVTLEVVYIPPGEFMMGSTPEERAWATGIEGGATPGTSREKPEGDPRTMRVKHGFWMARTEPAWAIRRFVESGYVPTPKSLAVGRSAFDPRDGYHLTTRWCIPENECRARIARPEWAFPNRDVFPVCVRM